MKADMLTLGTPATIINTKETDSTATAAGTGINASNRRKFTTVTHLIKTATAHIIHLRRQLTQKLRRTFSRGITNPQIPPTPTPSNNNFQTVEEAALQLASTGSVAVVEGG